MQLQHAAASGERYTIPTKGVQLRPAGNVVYQGDFLGGHNMAANKNPARAPRKPNNQ
jgi:hypothetical protein